MTYAGMRMIIFSFGKYPSIKISEGVLKGQYRQVRGIREDGN